MELKVNSELVLEVCEVILKDKEAMRSDELRKGEVAEKEKMQLKI